MKNQKYFYLLMGFLIAILQLALAIPTQDLDAHYDAASITPVGGNVTTWNDDSGNGHHLTGSASFVATDTHGLSSVRFAGNTLGNTGYAVPSAVGTMVVVTKADSSAGLQVLMSWSALGGGHAPYSMQVRFGNFTYGVSGSDATESLVGNVAADTQYHVRTLRYAPGDMDTFLDGAVDVQNFAGETGSVPSSTGFLVGNYNILNIPYFGNISEIFIYNRALTDEEIDEVEFAMGAKFDISIEGAPDPIPEPSSFLLIALAGIFVYRKNACPQNH